MLATILLATLLLQSVHGEGNDYTKEFSQANTKFTIDFYKAAAARNTNKSFISSPFSVSSLFNMILVGAKGTTSEEILKTLGYSDVGLGADQVRLANRKILGAEGSSFGADIANSVWNSKNFKVSQQYKDILTNDFNAKETELNFADSGATDTINDWVNEATHGKILKLFDTPLSPDTLLVLVNAIFFKESWKSKFPKEYTRNDEFRNGIGGTTQVPMMHVKTKFGYIRNETMHTQMLELDYNNPNLSMVIILPDNDDGLKSVEESLTNELLTESLEHLSHSKQQVSVFIPRIKLESTFGLIPIMQDLNTTRIFSGGADLTGISNDQGLYVTDAVQKAIVEVNEEGTVAAAASGSSMSRMAIIEPKPIVFMADHPFIFLIRNKKNNMILFIGRYT